MPSRSHFRKVPTRFKVTGDVPAGKALIGRGSREMSKFMKTIEFRGLKGGTKTLHLPDGVLMTMTVHRAGSNDEPTTTVDIHTPTVLPSGRKPVTTTTCGCCSDCVAIGKITQVYTGYKITYNDYGVPVKLDAYAAPLGYDIKVCQTDQEYVEYVSIPPADIEGSPYRLVVGSTVLAVFGSKVGVDFRGGRVGFVEHPDGGSKSDVYKTLNCMTQGDLQLALDTGESLDHKGLRVDDYLRKSMSCSLLNGDIYTENPDLYDPVTDCPSLPIIPKFIPMKVDCV